jgi:hypothetical protein
MTSGYLRTQSRATEAACEFEDGRRWHPRAALALSVGASALFWAAFAAAIFLFR